MRALVKRPHTRALSAWDTGTASQGLRPRPTAAMIVLSVDRPLRDVFKTDQAQIERTVRPRRLRSGPGPHHRPGRAGPRHPDESIDTTRRAELIADGHPVRCSCSSGCARPSRRSSWPASARSPRSTSLGALALLGEVRRDRADRDPLRDDARAGLRRRVRPAHRRPLPRAGVPARLEPRDAATAASEAVATTGRAVLLSGHRGDRGAHARRPRSGPAEPLRDRHRHGDLRLPRRRRGRRRDARCADDPRGRGSTRSRSPRPGFLARGWDWLVGARPLGDALGGHRRRGRDRACWSRSRCRPSA